MMSLPESYNTLSCIIGTRIIYDRKFLLQLRNSPLAKSPPGNLPDIPGVTSPDDRAKGGKIAEAKSESDAKGCSTALSIELVHQTHIYIFLQNRQPTSSSRWISSVTLRCCKLHHKRHLPSDLTPSALHHYDAL